MDQKKFIMKYYKAIEGISNKNGVDMGVAGDMLVHNARVIAAAANKAGKDWYMGTGIVNIDQLITDTNELEKSFKKASGKAGK